MKKLAYVIATLNEEDTIGELLDSLNKDRYPNKKIVVVDGGSRDRTVEIAREKGATVIKESGRHKCPANAWNCGIRFAKPDVFCILGADFLVPLKNFSSIAMKNFDKNTGVIYTDYSTEQTTLIEKIISNKRGTNAYPTFVRKDVYDKIGGFPTIGVSEDVIFTIKSKQVLKKLGLKEKYLHNIYYGGYAARTVSELFKQTKWYGRTSILFLKEYFKIEKSLFKKAKMTIATYSRIVYFLSFLLFLLFSLNIYFALPFAIIVTLIFLRNLREPYHIGKIFTHLVAGFGMLMGFLSYVSGLNRSRSRG